MSQIDPNRELQPQLLDPDGPVCLIIKAELKPVGGLDRFQPAGFPEIGHVIYDAPRDDGRKEKVCIVDSPASMANHLEAVCVADSAASGLHKDLSGLPYVRCVTDRNPRVENGTDVLDPKDPQDRIVATSFTEGHRIASEVFLDATRKTDKRNFRGVLRDEFKIIEVKKNQTYLIPPETWWSIYETVFRHDPNSLVHGVLFSREQIKISRFLTANLEAFGASRVGRSGVKFDPLRKTKSGQPIFAVDEETAGEIRATFILDLAMLRSYGCKVEKKANGGREVDRDEYLGLNDNQKRLLLDLALWKIHQLLDRPFRYRTQCYLQSKSDGVKLSTESQGALASQLPTVNIGTSIRACGFATDPITDVYYPANELFKPSAAAESATETDEAGAGEETEEPEEA